MMDVGIVMLVKNEVRRVGDALAPLLDQLSQVVVLDTGSTDGTQDLLRERFAIEPIDTAALAGPLFSKAKLRNHGLAMLRTDWCLSLDADERLDPAGFAALRAAEPADGIGGLFLRWHNVLEQGETFDDYKCALFRRGFTMTHLEHENSQTAVRREGSIAVWSDAVVLEHRPEGCKDAWKRAFYRERLAHAMYEEPDNPRYTWFAGYGAYFQDDLATAEPWLTHAADSAHPLYPVERLNARVVLTALAARQGRHDAARQHLAQALNLFDRLRDDFEVRINFWLEPWLDETVQLVDAGRFDMIAAPRFAH